MSTSPFLSYYLEKNIIPVRQDIDRLDLHFRRRSRLLLHLGIPPGLIGGKSIIEFGPGSGDNSIHMASLRPTRYVLVDKNPASLAMLREKVADGRISAEHLEVVDEDFFQYRDDQKYDLVWGEGIVPNQIRAADLLRQIGSFVTEGGLLVVTVNSATSIFAEVCRRMVKPILAARCDRDFNRLLQRCVAFFKPDLDALSGMSRRRDDWVLDVILHPLTSGTICTGLDVLATLGDSFDVYASSPRFLVDWRWYKQLTAQESGFNSIGAAALTNALAAFLDYRSVPERIGPVDVASLEVACRDAFDCHHGLWSGEDGRAIATEFLPRVARVAGLLRGGMPETAAALDDYVGGMRRLLSGAESVDMGRFVYLFGRGQQYLSLIRN